VCLWLCRIAEDEQVERLVYLTWSVLVCLWLCRIAEDEQMERRVRDKLHSKHHCIVQ